MKKTDMSIQLNRIIFVLAIAGIVMGVYVLQSFLRQSSIFCLTGSGCELVRRSQVSYPLGIPVPAFGVAGYTGIAVLAFLRTLRDAKKLVNGILGIAVFGICFVTWFTAMELFVIRGICMWCAISAANMYVIFALSVASARMRR